MRSSFFAWAAAALMAGVAHGQSPVQQAMALFPDCSLLCMKQFIPLSPCGLTDIECLCTNEELNANITMCALQGCTTYEALMTKNASMTMCGAPVRDKSHEPLVIGMVGGALAFVAFVLRMLSSLPMGGRSLGWDDYMIIVTVILGAPPTAFAVTLTNNGLGKDMWTLPLQNIKNVLRYYYLGEIFYFASITANKLSILLFVLRIFPERKFRNLLFGVCGLCVAYGITFIIVTAFQCSPVEWSWQQVDDNWGTGSCNNIHVQGWMSAIVNIIIDLIILVLPLKNLWGLQMQLKKKIMIMFMFSLGIFVTIISVIRLNSLILFANSQNITWDYTDAAWWSTLEIHIGIICACLPALRTLFIALGASVLKTKTMSKFTDKYATSKSAGSKGGSFARGKDEYSTSNTQKRGDEGDFVPLVDNPHNSAFDKGNFSTVVVSPTNDSDESHRR